MKLSTIFSNNMILQANKPVRIFGEGKGKVTVKIDNKEAYSFFDGEKWLLELDSFDYGGPYTMTVDLDGKKEILENIYFGDVYLLSGQSNNKMKLWSTNTPKEYYKGNDSIRLFSINALEKGGEHILTDEGWKSLDKNGNIIPLIGSEHYNEDDGWVSAQDDTVCFWPAVGFLSASFLAKDSNKKIGLIACYQGASVIQSWLPNHFLDSTEFFVPLEERGDNAQNPFYCDWNGDGMLYDGMLKKILPFSVKAVLWYQGEGNYDGKDGRKEIYSSILKMLIERWREDFKDNSLPFVVVQIHDYLDRINEEGSHWKDVQSAQKEVCNTVDNTFLVMSNDVCETDDIHPVSKLELSKRVAAALKKIV